MSFDDATKARFAGKQGKFAFLALGDVAGGSYQTHNFLRHSVAYGDSLGMQPSAFAIRPFDAVFDVQRNGGGVAPKSPDGFGNETTIRRLDHSDPFFKSFRAVDEAKAENLAELVGKENLAGL